MNDSATDPQEKVGFRDIYRAVGESESRIKEHISLVLLPITSAVADHEVRLRNIEEKGSDEARAAFAAATALTGRVDTIESTMASSLAAGIERRRLAALTNKGLAAIVLVSNFVIGIIIMFANILTDHARQ